MKLKRAFAQWLSTLEITNRSYFVRPYYRNYEKRLIKSPKVYFLDSGLLCHLLGIHTLSDIQKSPFAGFIFESFVLSELLKGQINQGKAKEIYYFRDDAGLEVDFIVPKANDEIEMIEVKYTKTVVPGMVGNIRSLQKNIREQKFLASIIHNGDLVDNEVLCDDIRGYNYRTYFGRE